MTNTTDNPPIAKHALNWLKAIQTQNGNKCGNCGAWRVLLDRHVERCGTCRDDEYDIYELAENFEDLP